MLRAFTLYAVISAPPSLRDALIAEAGPLLLAMALAAVVSVFAAWAVAQLISPATGPGLPALPKPASSDKGSVGSTSARASDRVRAALAA